MTSRKPETNDAESQLARVSEQVEEAAATELV